jgi:RNA polymerase sigma-70 factor (ECF subfamily)
VLLEDQDRALWSRDRIEEGLRVLNRAVSLGSPGPYVLQGAIAAAHAEERPREDIVALYDRLAMLYPSPIVLLNRAVAVALAGRIEDGLALIDELGDLDGYHLFHAARADLLRRLERQDEAAAAYREALALVANDAERAYLERRLLEVS